MRVIYGWILFFAAIAVIMGGGLLMAVLLGIAAFIAGREYLAIADMKCSLWGRLDV